MSNIELKRRMVTALGIKFIDDRWWADELTDHVGDYVYVYPKNGLVASKDLRLLVFDAEPSKICEATRLENPHRLLQSFCSLGVDPLKDSAE